MTLSQVVETYIAYKRSLGKDFRSKAAKLRAFVKSVGDGDIRRVDPFAVRRFLDGSGPVTSNWFYKYHTLATFYRYAQAHHYVQNCPLPRSKPRPPEKYQPYIYTNDDMRKLIDAADSRHRYTWFLTPNTIRTLLLLLYGTGLRISEALRLNIEEFDRNSGVLTIRETKFFKSRLVPVGPDLRRVLLSIE
jgi:integrase/recombinase XerD